MSQSWSLKDEDDLTSLVDSSSPTPICTDIENKANMSFRSKDSRCSSSRQDSSSCEEVRSKRNVQGRGNTTVIPSSSRRKGNASVLSNFVGKAIFSRRNSSSSDLNNDTNTNDNQVLTSHVGQLNVTNGSKVRLGRPSVRIGNSLKAGTSGSTSSMTSTGTYSASVGVSSSTVDETMKEGNKSASELRLKKALIQSLSFDILGDTTYEEVSQLDNEVEVLGKSNTSVPDKKENLDTTALTQQRTFITQNSVSTLGNESLTQRPQDDNITNAKHQPQVPDTSSLLNESIRFVESIAASNGTTAKNDTHEQITKPHVTDLSEAVIVWRGSLDRLIRSREMSSLVHATYNVSTCTLDLIFSTSTYPFRITYRILATTTASVVYVPALACKSSLAMLKNASNVVVSSTPNVITNMLLGSGTSAGEASTESRKTSNTHPISYVIRTAVSLPGVVLFDVPKTILEVAFKVTDDVFSSLTSVVSGNNEENKHDVVIQDNDDDAWEPLPPIAAPPSSMDGNSEERLEEEDSSVSSSYLASPGQSTSEKRNNSPPSQRSSSVSPSDYLDRLRLDCGPHVETRGVMKEIEVKRVHPPIDSLSTGKIVNSTKKRLDARVEKETTSVSHQPDMVGRVTPAEAPATSSDRCFGTSRFLLRVDDVQLLDTKSKLHYDDFISYLDLSSGQISDRALLKEALDLLVVRGLSMLANHPPARLSSKQYITTPVTEVKWNVMGSSTKNSLREMSQMTNTLDRLERLRKETLIWSGEYAMQKGVVGECGRNSSLYLARGIVEFKPREFLELLWNEERAKEYNKHSNGRHLELSIENGNDEILRSGSSITTGIKTVRSETNVPFTKFSVETRCLMHVRALDAPDDGYVILSRSLDHGDSGIHYSSVYTPGKKKVEKGDNQILWGINIIKHVPNHPHLTDLISLSQVHSANVPGFLSKRIALMGIEDFFNNVRKIAASKTSEQELFSVKNIVNQ